ncbi:MAG: hypothetical protein RIR16_135 [Actinomycetota bacterium]|jgi:O-succinylbenzoic acid--CoA ligase
MPKPLKLIAANDTFSALLAFAEVLAERQAVFVTPPEVNGKLPEVHGLPDEVDDSVALIIESSGSTGVPKRIELSTAQLIQSANASAEYLGGHGQWLLALPINYIAGANVLIRSLVAETHPVMMNAQLPFTPEGFSRAASLMSGERRYTSLVPTQVSRLVAALSGDEMLLEQLKRFDRILIGGQAPNAEDLEVFDAHGIRYSVTYGATETAGGCVYDGVPLSGVRVEIVEGQIKLNDHLTGDLGELDEFGRLRVLGRRDRVINSGGLKISLDHLEATALKVSGVEAIAASALADAEWGQRVGLVYVGSPEVADDIALQLAEALGPAGKPVRVVRVDQLPRLANGKTDLLAVAKIFEELDFGR